MVMTIVLVVVVMISGFLLGVGTDKDIFALMIPSMTALIMFGLARFVSMVNLFSSLSET